MTTIELERMVDLIPAGIETKGAAEIELEIKNIKTSILAALGSKADLATVQAMQGQLDALDVSLAQRHVAAMAGKGLNDFLDGHDGIQRLFKDKRGEAVLTLPTSMLERKTNITDTAVGYATSGVLLPDRISGIVTEARQQLLVRNALTARPTTMAMIDFVKVNTPLAAASPQTEASDKGENAVTFTTASEKVQTLATWIPASRQVLDDMSELMNFLQTSLPYKVNLLEEVQMLSGSGSDPNLNGLVTQATAFNTGLLNNTAGWTRIDIIGRAIQQVTAAKELAPTFIVVHPTDWWAIRLTKDSYGRYILGDPMQPVTANLFGLMPIITTSIASGTFLVGSGSPIASEIRDRMEMVVEISTSHSDFFAKNLIAIRAEKRLALIVKRPASYITGSFTTSPSS